MTRRIFSTEMAYLSRVIRKPAFCMCENKSADPLRGTCPTDKPFCFRYIDSTIFVNGCGSITSVGEEGANLSAVVYL